MNTARADIGAAQNRLDYAAANLIARLDQLRGAWAQLAAGAAAPARKGRGQPDQAVAVTI